jgi:chromosome segregation ATPase
MNNSVPPSWNDQDASIPLTEEDLAFQEQVMQAQGKPSSTDMHAPTLEDMLTRSPETSTPAQDTDLARQVQDLARQVEELEALNVELKADATRSKQALEKALSATTNAAGPRAGAADADADRYRLMLDKARERLSQAEKELDMARAREQDYENLLEEKSEQIRKLHLKVTEAPSHAAGHGTPSEEELRQLFAELQRERQILEDDKAVMEEQYKMMELGMSRERAELARQRAEVKRLQAELEHLKNTIARGDQTALNQLREEFQGKKASGTNLQRPTPPPTAKPSATPQQMPALDRKAPEPPADAENPKKSIFGRRFFTGK